MTDTYIAGFRKAAEQCGVDPEALLQGQIKQAVISPNLLPKNLIKHLVRSSGKPLAAAGTSKITGNSLARDLLKKRIDKLNDIMNDRWRVITQADYTYDRAFPGLAPTQFRDTLQHAADLTSSRQARISKLIESYRDNGLL